MIRRELTASFVAALFVLLATAPVIAIAAELEVSNDQWITFLSHRTGTNLLYKMRPDGSELEVILGGPLSGQPTINNEVRIIREPHWTRLSPHRHYFASWVYEVGRPYSKWQGEFRPTITIGDLHGKWTRVLHPAAEEEFAWSLDGTQLAFAVISEEAGQENRANGRQNPRQTKIVTSGFDGSYEEVVFESSGLISVQDWSPDGERLLLVRQSGSIRPGDFSSLFEYDLTRREIVSDWKLGSEGFSVVNARYSPAGRSIAILWTDTNKQFAPNERAKDELGRGRMLRMLGKLSLMNYRSKELMLLADHPYGQRGPICWSPDGKSVLLSRYLKSDDSREQFEDEHGLGIWDVKADGSGDHFVTTGWSPDWH